MKIQAHLAQSLALAKASISGKKAGRFAEFITVALLLQKNATIIGENTPGLT